MTIAVRGSVWDPFATLVRQFDTDFDRLTRVDGLAGGLAGRAAHGRTGFVPAADVRRDGADVLITLELPGVDVENDVEVEVADGRLTVRGERNQRQESEQDGVVVREIRSGRFVRSFRLPKGRTAEHVDASYDQGLLRMRVREVTPPTPAVTTVPVRIGAAPAESEAQPTAQDTQQATGQAADGGSAAE